jgi:hypothetical protein
MRTILCAAVAANCFTSPVMAEVQTWPKSEPEWPMKTCPYQDNFDIYTETIPYFHEEAKEMVSPISMDILTRSSEIRDSVYIRWAPHTEVEVYCMPYGMSSIVRSDTFYEVLVPQQQNE